MTYLSYLQPLIKRITIKKIHSKDSLLYFYIHYSHRSVSSILFSGEHRALPQCQSVAADRHQCTSKTQTHYYQAISLSASWHKVILMPSL